jgi:hypothetical protein
MARKQTRRTVSLCADTYARLREHAEQRQTTMSDVVEKLLAPVLHSTPPVAKPRRPVHGCAPAPGGGVRLW